MISIQTPVDDLKDLIQVFAGFESTIGDFVFDVALEAKKNIQDRVQNQGMATNGSYLITQSSNQIGRYSKQHGEVRMANSLQVSIVDLTFTGQMWSSYTEDRNGNETKVFFDNDEASAKAAYQEEYYDTPIFYPSENEDLKNVDKMADDFIDNFFASI